MEGNLWNPGRTSVVEKGISGVAEAEQYPLSEEVRPLKDETWDAMCARFTTGSSAYRSVGGGELRVRDKDGNRTVAVVVGKGQKFVLSGPLLDVHILVVRHGGQLLLRPPLEVRAECILVESGGLLQAGAKGAPALGPVRFTLSANPHGFLRCGVLTSQYSYKFYAPGTKRVAGNDAPSYTGLDGTQNMIMNTFGPRCFAVGFCGRVALYSDVGGAAPRPYKGTWSVLETGAQEVATTTPFADLGGDAVDVTPSFLSLGARGLRDGYPVIFTRFRPVQNQKNQVQLLSEQGRPVRFGKNELGHWAVGREVLLTFVPSEFCAAASVDGATEYTLAGGHKVHAKQVAESGSPPVWLPPDQKNRDAMESVLRVFAQTGGHDLSGNPPQGLEVAVIQSIDREKGLVTFRENLRLDHKAPECSFLTGEGSTSNKKKRVSVSVYPFAALLSRSITIEPEFQAELAQRGGGAGEAKFVGPGGRLVPDFAVWPATADAADISNICFLQRDRILHKYFQNPASLSSQTYTRDSRVYHSNERRWLLIAVRALAKKELVKMEDHAHLGYLEELFSAGETGQKFTEAAVLKVGGNFLHQDTAFAVSQGLFDSDRTKALRAYDEWYVRPPQFEDGGGGASPLETGCWQLGTEGQQGTNALLGAHAMVRCGAAVVFSGVDFRRMGVAANSGSIGRYALHFHLSGWARSWQGYTKEGGAAPREHLVEHCTFRQTPSRAVNLHGALEVQLVNNVSFLNYGSAWFLEEGVERFNVMEHNLAALTLPCRFSPLDNPAGILPNAAFDFNAASIFWLKNNTNVLARNVMCNCPRFVVGVWAINQHIGFAKNIASLCTGDEDLKIPSTASQFFYSGDEWGASCNSYSRNPNRGPRPVDVTTGKELPNGQAQRPTKNWFPPEWKERRPASLAPTAVTKDLQANCGTTTNSTLPLFCCSDNVCYGVATYFSNYIGFYPAQPYADAREAPNGLAVQSQGTIFGGRQLLLPHNAPNTAVDLAVVEPYAQPSFFGGTWKESYPELPEGLSGQVVVKGNDILSASGEDTFTTGTNRVMFTLSLSQGIGEGLAPGGSASPPGYKCLRPSVGASDSVPMLFASHQVLGTLGVASQMGGTLWNKSDSTILANCCHLGAFRCRTGLTGFTSAERATAAVASHGDDNNRFENSIVCFHNFVCDGGTDLLPNPTVFSGAKTRLGEGFKLLWFGGNVIEYINARDKGLLKYDHRQTGLVPTEEKQQPVAVLDVYHSPSLPAGQSALLLQQPSGSADDNFKKQVHHFLKMDAGGKWKMRTASNGEQQEEEGSFAEGQLFPRLVLREGSAPTEAEIKSSLWNQVLKRKWNEKATFSSSGRFLRRPFVLRIANDKGAWEEKAAEVTYGLRFTGVQDLEEIADGMLSVRPGIVYHRDVRI